MTAYMDLVVRPWTVRQAIPWVARVHRRLPKVQGGLWAIRIETRAGETRGCAIVGHPARVWQTMDVLALLRMAVLEGTPNGCSMLYGACSRAAKAMGATSLVTYLHDDEPGTSLRASGWVFDGWTDGGEWARSGRQRTLAVDPRNKQRWFAPWSERIKRGGRAEMIGG